MSTTNETASLHICAVWLVRANRKEDTSIRFWSQILNCQATRLKTLMVQVERLERPCRDRIVSNELLINIHGQMEGYTPFQCKHLLDTSRKFEEAKNGKQ